LLDVVSGSWGFLVVVSGGRLEVVLVVFRRKTEKMNGDCRSLIWGFNLV